MSAICGYWTLRGEEEPRAMMARLMAALEAHGPDGQSVAHSQAISFGHQLLRITLEDSFEAQPLTGRAGGQPILLVADARINNRAQLAETFELTSAEIVSLPDSAFVLRAWERWRQDCVAHLVGAFAFAVWDSEARQLFLARDHAGERPLYYCRTANGFAFATTARALLVCAGVGAEIDETTCARDLIGLPPEPFRTRFRDIRQIAPGHSMVVAHDAADAEPRRYWRFDQLPDTRFSRDRDYVDAFLEVFDEAVRCRLRTTGGIGAHLSSGLDSGSVVATAAGLLAESNARLTAFTAVPRPDFAGVIPQDCIGDEGPFAAEVAALYPNVEHLRVDSSGTDMLQEMARAFQWLERPLGAPTNQIWVNLILDRAKNAGINVLLTGTLGNATISYSGGDILSKSFRSGRWLRTVRQAVELRRNGMSSGSDAASLTVFSLLPWALRSRLDPSMRGLRLEDTGLRPERGRELNLLDQVRRYGFLSETHLPPLMQTFFHANVLGDHDTMTNAGWGIETRDPTADKRVFEFCASIPLEQYLVDKPGRSLIRRAMRGRLPDATLDRRIRGLQGADWYESLTPIRVQLAAELALLQSSPGARRLLDLDRLRSAVDRWPQTARAAADEAMLYQMIVPDSIAVGYFIRRCEEMKRASGASNSA